MLVALRKIAAVGSIAFLAVLGGTATASAQPNAPRDTQVVSLQNASTHRCVDDSDFNFRTSDCDGSGYQRWSGMFFTEDGSYRFQNLATGRCIDDSDFAFRANDCNVSDYQKWYLTPNGNGHRFQNLATKRCIDDSDFAFRTNTCNTSVYQTFYQVE